MRKPTPIKRTLAFTNGAALDDGPAIISVIIATENPSPPTVVLSTADSSTESKDAEETPAHQDTPGEVLGALEAEDAAEAEPAAAEIAVKKINAALPAAAVVPFESRSEGSAIPSAEAVGAMDGGAEPLAAVEKVPEPLIDSPVEAAPVPDAEPALAPSLAAESSEVAPAIPALSA